jgi:hypothetical protein
MRFLGFLLRAMRDVFLMAVLLTFALICGLGFVSFVLEWSK